MTQARFKTSLVVEIPDELVVGTTTTNAYVNSTYLEFRTGGSSNGVLEPTRLHLGNSTANAVLNSTALAFDGVVGGSSGDLVRLANGNFSSASEVDFDVSGYSQTNFRIMMEYENTQTTEVAMRWSTDGASTFESSSNYHTQFLRGDIGSWHSEFSENISYGYMMWDGDSGKSNSPAAFVADLRGMGSSSDYSYVTSLGYNEWGADYTSNEGWSIYKVAEAHDGFRIYPNGGSFTGRWVLYGLNS